MSECALIRKSGRNAMETIQRQGTDIEHKPLNAEFGQPTTAAEAIAGVILESKVAITSRRSERV
jgi:hypothetical protein